MLLKNNVFGSLRLVQEVALARNVTLHCSAHAIHYTDFVDAVTIYLSYHKHISVLLSNGKKNPQALTDRQLAIIEGFIYITNNALRPVVSSSQDQESEAPQRLLNLESLVANLSEFNSKDPRDRIYSVLALAKDGPSWLESSINGYEKTTLEVFQDFFIHVFRDSQRLDIMCRKWTSSVVEKDASIPTWIRPLQSNFQTSSDSNISERTEANCLVGNPNRRWYNAAKNTKANFKITFPTSPDKRKLLVVTGFRLDIISKLGPRASEGIILHEWLQMGGCITSKEVDTVPDAFWRTLVADRGPNGSNAPSWYRRAFLYCLAESTPTGDINTSRLIETGEVGSNLVIDFLERVQSIIWNRKLIVSQKSNLIGLAPPAAQENDIICVLHGCSVPVILRERVGMGGETFWYLVGECYVHGMMNGEAMEGRGLDVTEDFEIR
ncbi:hypothetical protein IFR05_016954 [Cadophora sp. M221]|nr:hypothetical protein IFR05_016954 [Cadophora sp. M221]